MKRQHISVLAGMVLGAMTGLTQAEVVPDDVKSLYMDWAHIRYELPSDQQKKGYEELKNRADQVADSHPDNATAWIWRGIIASTYAGAKGGLSALSLVKEARSSLEHALEIDASAFNGAAYTSLGALYYQVPGWPISFGDDDKARDLLQKGLELNPQGIDANFFYGDFLADQGDDKMAREYLNKALNAAPRPDRPVADAGRREEIYAVLNKLKK
ncbi:hypothetical protein BTA51_23280 [Hahella sp. CCB-MM4]|uniref:tetratricopeptide repeat protein n=1 Tax=Hahella sp. (strain CCB-MM4) TaxID=1926491 RepID=UPI000BD0755E|nr:tetratricopeptide repeat protein [Hahella sp. CCB-MM4]OZG71030.1 hypothetical protein BTA51_23280 [Hahella sp. CCB-MM4]